MQFVFLDLAGYVLLIYSLVDKLAFWCREPDKEAVISLQFH